MSSSQSPIVIVKKTKKLRKTPINKKAMWDKFDEADATERNATERNATVKNTYAAGATNTIECVFRASGEREHCDCCQTMLFFSDEGFLTCPNKTCGVIYTDMIDQGAEWRYYGADDNQSGDPTRCGMPINPLLKESSYGFKMMCTSKSSYEMRKIRRYMEWQSMPYNEKARYDDFHRITVLAEQGGIPKIIIDDAMRYHKKISEAKTFRGLNRDGIIAATIYVGARINNYPRTAKEIATIFHLDNTSATRGCKNAISIINEIEHELHNDDKTSFCSTTPSSFMERYCSRLNINAELTKLCKFIAMRIQDSNLIPENTPNSIAAGIVYFVSHVFNLNVTKRNVNHVSETSEVTINKCFKKLDEMRASLIPQTLLQKYSIV